MPSTVIRRLSYDSAQRTLDVSFVSGRRYRYLEVPSEVAEGFRGAFVKGRYFSARIRDRYACEELEEDADWGA